MGEAFLHGHGGNGLRYKGLSASLPAPYNVFYNGQGIDISHAVITANLGKVTMQVPPESCTFSPQTATASTTAITVSYSIGSVTRTASIPITVLSLSNVFANNTWAQIAQAAHYGFPKYLWQPGDMKTLTIGSTTHTIRIIGFDMIPRNWAVQATDQNAYAKQFSRVLAILSLSPILSGIAGLIWGEGICGILLGVLSLALIFLCVKLFSPRKDDK